MGVGRRGGSIKAAAGKATMAPPSATELEPLLDVEATVSDEESLAVSESKLMVLLALLLRSALPSPLVVALGPGTPGVPPTGLSKSNPNCSKERLKDVVLGWMVSWSWGGQSVDMVQSRGVHSTRRRTEMAPTDWP